MRLELPDIKYIFEPSLMYSRKVLLWSLLIFSIVFWLWRLPFLLWVPVPIFYSDSFQYFMIVKYLTDGKIFMTDRIGHPLGFPLFAYLIGLFSNKILTVVIFQFFIKYAACLLLLYFIYKNYSRLAAPAAFAMAVYATDSFSLKLDTTLYPDSLFSSFLILSAAFVIDAVKSRSRSSVFSLSIVMFLTAFTRSNGIFIYYLIPLLLLFFLNDRQLVLKLGLMVIPALLLHSLVFMLKKNSPFFGASSNRFSSVVERESDWLNTSSESYFEKKLSIARKYFSMVDMPSYYFSVLPVKYRELYKGDIIHSPENRMFGWKVVVPTDLRIFTYKEYYTKPDILNRNESKMDISYAYKNPLYLLIHFTYKIQNLLFRTFIWYLLGAAAVFIAMYMLVQNKLLHDDALMVFLLGSMHFVSIATVVIGHDTYQARYAHVSEFLLYLSVILALTFILPVSGRRRYAE